MFTCSAAVHVSICELKCTVSLFSTIDLVIPSRIGSFPHSEYQSYHSLTPFPITVTYNIKGTSVHQLPSSFDCMSYGAVLLCLDSLTFHELISILRKNR